MKFSAVLKILITIISAVCGWFIWQDYSSQGNMFDDQSKQSKSYQITTALIIMENADSTTAFEDGFNLLQQIQLKTSKNELIKQTSQQLKTLLASKQAIIRWKKFQTELLASYDDITFQLESLQVKTWGRDNATVSELHLLQKIHSLLQKNQTQFEYLPSLINNTEKAALEEQVATNLLQLNSYLEASQSGSETLGIKRLRSAAERREMATIQESLLPVNSEAELIIANFATLYDGLIAMKWLKNNANQLAISASITEQITQQLSSQLFLVIGILMIILSIIYYFERRNAVRQLINEKKYNDLAISRLLDEVADLSDGDLTVKATVTEDFTGVVADSLNFAIEQLQKLALKVNDTAENVISISHETSASSQQLQQRAEQQHEEMQEYCKGLNDISKGLNQVIDRIDEATQVVNSSTDIIAHNMSVMEYGQNLIKDAALQINQARNCVSRMTDYCDQIQLVLSQFQENTEKTRLTALNTSLQAAQSSNNRSLVLMTDEIMNLSERMSGSSQQIKNLFAALNTEAKGSIGSLESLIETFDKHIISNDKMVDSARHIVGDTEYSNDLMEGIVEKMNNYQMIAQHIATRIQEMEEGTFSSLHEITETSRVVQELTTYALSLKESTTGYKLHATNDDVTFSNQPLTADISSDSAVNNSQYSNDSSTQTQEDNYPSIDLPLTSAPKLFDDDTADDSVTPMAEPSLQEQEQDENSPSIMNTDNTEHDEDDKEQQPLARPPLQTTISPSGIGDNDLSVFGRLKKKINNYPL